MTIDHREQLERIKAEIADSFDEELEMQLEEDRLDALVAEAHDALAPFGDRAGTLRALAAFVANRSN